ncbi:hypothetical protein PYCCODRAFT_1422606 [Trametes coccinea BRFM310]|uniref:Uncharacterized protein n=1 Tax=Trametes coccinea (strain BRFM310) TaxID=1353009 RepID=A0A1Y2J266_TRAC3|nr:hypothetical protein PYCCODRAFT_1422606 [Trametes coccinea BRFM310]
MSNWANTMLHSYLDYVQPRSIANFYRVEVQASRGVQGLGRQCMYLSSRIKVTTWNAAPCTPSPRRGTAASPREWAPKFPGTVKNRAFSNSHTLQMLLSEGDDDDEAYSRAREATQSSQAQQNGRGDESEDENLDWDCRLAGASRVREHRAGVPMHLPPIRPGLARCEGVLATRKRSSPAAPLPTSPRRSPHRLTPRSSPPLPSNAKRQQAPASPARIGAGRAPKQGHRKAMQSRGISDWASTPRLLGPARTPPPSCLTGDQRWTRTRHRCFWTSVAEVVLDGGSRCLRPLRLWVTVATGVSAHWFTVRMPSGWWSFRGGAIP